MIPDLASLKAMLTGPTLVAYLLTWTTVAIAALVTFRRSGKSLWQHLVPPGTLTNPSARTDVFFWLARIITKQLFVLPTMITAVGVGSLIHTTLSRVLPTPHPEPAGPIALVVFTITILLAFDLSYYIYHYAQHKVPVLWELHKVHHSAEVLVGVTQGRVHPLDDFMNKLWDGVLPGLVYGIWLFFVSNPTEITVFGLNAFVIRNILMMDFVRHTHFRFSFGWLNRVIICPHYHQLHHSINPRHWDKNFGLMLTIWDYVFGTLVVPEPDEEFQFGLTDGEHHEYQSLAGVYVLPIIKMWRMLVPTARSKTAT